MVAKELAKTQSLAASFRNISQYLSLIERARNTIQGVGDKLTELDSTVSEAAGLIDSDDYAPVSVGAIAGASIEGLASGSGTFSAVSPLTTSGKGLDLHSQSVPMAPVIITSSILNPTARAMRLMIRLPLLGRRLAAVPAVMTPPSQSLI